MADTEYDKLLGNYIIGQFYGFNLIESRFMTIAGKTKVYKTTRKWKPKKIKRITETLPNPEVMVMGQTIVGHPKTIYLLRKKLGI